MADDQNRQSDPAAQPPEEDGLTLQERIDRQMEARRAAKAQKASEQQPQPAARADAKAGASSGPPAGASDPNGPPPEEDGLTLQERIDRQMEARRAAKAQKASEQQPQPAARTGQQARPEGEPMSPSAQPDPSRPGQGTLMEIIAQQRAKLQAKMAGKPVEPGQDPSDGAPAPSAEANLQTVGGKPVSLQEIVAQQRDKLKQKLAGDEGPNPAGKPGAPRDVRDKGLVDEVKPAGTPGDAPTPRRSGGNRPIEADVAVVAGRRQWLTQGMLVANTFVLAAVGGLVLYMLANRVPEPTAADEVLKVVRAAQMARTSESPDSPTAPRAVPATTQDSNSPPAGAVAAALAAPSWDAAAAAFDKRDYDAAAERYSRLLLASRSVPSEALAGEFFQYRIAQCMWQLGRMAEAQQILDRLVQGDCPIIRAVSSAALARVAAGDQKHLLSRTLAYQTLAELKAVEEPVSLEADCDYMIARAVTEKVRSFHGDQEGLPWSRLQLSDVFAGRTEAEVRRLLDSGSRTSWRAAPAGIRIDKTPGGWTVHCAKAALEDVLHQFAVKAGKDVRWNKVAPAVRRRIVSFTFRDVPEQRVFELACGAAGLSARFTWEQVVVEDPPGMDSLAEQRESLSNEAISCWRRFSLRFPEDDRAAESHFALGALYEWAGDTVGAMKQYQLVGHQHQQELELAPQALMRSAKLRMGLRDYAGASGDLLDLLDLYPQYPNVDRVYLSLGRVNKEAGKLDSAARIFLKVQNLECSPDSRRAALLEAGECHYRLGDYAEASKYLSRCITSAQDGGEGDMVRAFLLLGRSEGAQGNRPAAVAAFRQALAYRPLRNEYVEVVLALTQVQTEAGDHVPALGTLRRIEKEDLSEEQTYRYLMAGSALYRAMGVPDRARAFLRERGGALSGATLRARLAVEQARCLEEAGDLHGARQGLSEAVGQLASGPEAWQAALDLADLALRLDDSDQAIVVAREVVRSTCPDDVRRRALELLGRAYLRRKDYEQAAATLAALGATSVQAKPQGERE